ncbi:hypothetical protein [Nocardia sp. MW-W600-9]
MVLVDDQALIRKGFRMILEETDDIDIVGEAENGFDAVRLAAELDPVGSMWIARRWPVTHWVVLKHVESLRIPAEASRVYLDAVLRGQGDGLTNTLAELGTLEGPS